MASTIDAYLILPIALMRETADQLDQSGAAVQRDIASVLRQVRSQAWELPRDQQVVEQRLEGHFNSYYQQLLTARSSISALLRLAADIAEQTDRDIWRALAFDQ